MPSTMIQTLIYITVAAIIVAAAMGIGASFNRRKLAGNPAPARTHEKQ